MQELLLRIVQQLVFLKGSIKLTICSNITSSHLPLLYTGMLLLRGGNFLLGKHYLKKSQEVSIHLKYFILKYHSCVLLMIHKLITKLVLLLLKKNSALLMLLKSTIVFSYPDALHFFEGALSKCRKPLQPCWEPLVYNLGHTHRKLKYALIRTVL